MVYRFGPFELCEKDFCLRRDGAVVSIQPLVWSTLRHLIRTRNRVVTKDELVRAVWAGTAVSPGAVTQAVSLARQAVRVSEAVEPFIRTVRGRGYKFEGAVTELEDEAPDRTEDRAEAAAVPRRAVARVLGRESDLMVLSATLQDAVAGAGSLILIGGEPGIGKTTLLEAAAETFAGAGARVVWGRCREDRSAVAYWPWTQVATALDGAGLEPDIADRPWLQRLFPALASRSATGRPFVAPPALPDGEGRARAFHAMAKWLSTCGVRRPLVLLLDDLHCADEPSCKLLQHVASSLSRAHVLVVGTFRDTEVPPTRFESPFDPGLFETRHRLSLRGLSRAACDEFLLDRLGRAVPRVLADNVARLTGGSPFLLQESVRTLQPLDGPLLPFELETILHLPERGLAAARRALSEVSEPVRTTLAIASVLGREFETSLLSRLMHAEAATVLRHLHEAASAGLIRVAAAGRMQFTHVLIQQAIYESMPLDRRAELHETSATIMAATQPADEDRTALIASHFARAAATRPTSSGLQWVRTAARHAHERLAFEQAAALFSHTVVTAEMLDESRSLPSLLLELGESLRCAGKVRAAMETFEKVASLARAQGDVAAFVAGALGYSSTQKGFGDAKLIGLLQEALELIDSSDHLSRARLQAELCFALRQISPVEQGTPFGASAVETARQLGNTAILSRALHAYRWSAPGTWPIDRLLSLSYEAIEVAEAAGDLALAAEARTWLIGDLLEAGDAEGVEREIARHNATADVLRQPAHQMMAARYLAVRALMRGDLADAEQLALKARFAGQTLGDELAELVYVCHLMIPRREQGRLAELEPFTRAVAASLSSQVWRSFLAFLLTETGRNAEAAEIVADILPAPGVRGCFNYLTTSALLAETCVALGDKTRGHQLYEALLPHAERNVSVGGGTLLLGPVQRYLGLLASLLGRTHAAIEHLTEGTARMRTMGAKHWYARSLVELARALIAQASAPAREQAVVHLKEAAVLIPSLPSPRLADELQRLTPGP